MTKEEALKEGQILGGICRIMYDEHYLPNCIGEPIKTTGFFLSPEFLELLKTIPKETLLVIKKRAEDLVV